MEDFELDVKKHKERYNNIKELAMSIIEDMTKLGLTFNEYEYLKTYMDMQIKDSKIII